MIAKRMSAFVLVVFVAVSVIGCQTLTGQSAGQYIDDKTISTQVKARLVASEAENLTRVDVDTQNGTVYLSGIVPSAEYRARAEQIARSEEGVRSVVNNLQVGRITR